MEITTCYTYCMGTGYPLTIQPTMQHQPRQQCIINLPLENLGRSKALPSSSRHGKEMAQKLLPMKISKSRTMFRCLQGTDPSKDTFKQTLCSKLKKIKNYREQLKSRRVLSLKLPQNINEKNDGFKSWRCELLGEVKILH